MSNAFWLNLIVVLLLLNDYGKSKLVEDDCTCTTVCRDDNKEQLGQGTWRLLHAITENIERNDDNEKLFKNFIQSLQYLYPCRQCRKHLREMDLHDIQMTPSWLCSFHNKVNLRLGKKLYNCSKYDITVAGNR